MRETYRETYIQTEKITDTGIKTKTERGRQIETNGETVCLRETDTETEKH